MERYHGTHDVGKARNQLERVWWPLFVNVTESGFQYLAPRTRTEDMQRDVWARHGRSSEAADSSASTRQTSYDSLHLLHQRLDLPAVVAFATQSRKYSSRYFVYESGPEKRVSLSVSRLFLMDSLHDVRSEADKV